MTKKTDAPLPYYKWYWQDWRSNRAVQRMSYVERGLYRELLDECWSEGGIPTDMESLADICGCPVEVMANAWQVLARCFHLVDGCYRNEKLDSLRTERDAVRVKRKDAGRLGGLRKSLNEKDSVANASHLPEGASVCHIGEERREEESRENQSATPPIPDTPKKPKGQPRGTRLPDDFTLTDELRAAAEKIGVPSGAVHIEADQFADHWKAKTGKDAYALDWLARWRTWCRNSVKWTYSKSGSGVRHDGANQGAGRRLSAVERAQLENEQHRARRESAGGVIVNG